MGDVKPINYGPVWEKTPDGKWSLPDKTLGWDVLGWTAKYLRQPDGGNAGNPWKYTPEQARFILWWYAIDDAGVFLYRYGVMRRPKGHGKDPFAATIALTELVGPCRFGGWDGNGDPIAIPHPAGWVQVAAVNQDQTRNTMTLFPGMISDELKNDYSLDPGKTLIYGRNGKCRLEAVTSSPRALEGGRSTFVIMNETHHWVRGNDGHEMARVIARNAGKGRDGAARALAITNAHLPGEDSVGEQDWNAFDGFLSGEQPDIGVLYDSLEAPAGLDERNTEDVKAGIVAARGDSNWTSIDRTAQEFLALVARGQGAEAQRFYWNRVCGTDAQWMDLDTWRAQKRPYDVEGRERICLGFDGSRRQDSTVLVASRLSDGYMWTVKAWEKPHGPAGNSWSVPSAEVDGEVDRLFREYDVVRMYCDPPHWQDYVDRWSATYGDKVVLEFWTNSGVRMAKALERFHTAVYAGELFHDGDDVLTRHIGNAMSLEKNGGTQIRKRKDSDKIDAVVSAVLAYEARNDAVADGALVIPNYDFWSWDEL